MNSRIEYYNNIIQVNRIKKKKKKTNFSKNHGLDRPGSVKASLKISLPGSPPLESGTNCIFWCLVAKFPFISQDACSTYLSYFFIIRNKSIKSIFY